MMSLFAKAVISWVAMVFQSDVDASCKMRTSFSLHLKSSDEPSVSCTNCVLVDPPSTTRPVESKRANKVSKDSMIR